MPRYTSDHLNLSSRSRAALYNVSFWSEKPDGVASSYVLEPLCCRWNSAFEALRCDLFLLGRQIRCRCNAAWQKDECYEAGYDGLDHQTAPVSIKQARKSDFAVSMIAYK